MTYRLRFSSAALLAAGALLFSALGAASHGARDRAPAEVVQLLDSLAKSEATVDQLRQSLRPVLTQQYGDKYRIRIVLTEAIRTGALRHSDVLQALYAEGCPGERYGTGSACTRIMEALSERPQGSTARAQREELHGQLDSLRVQLAAERAENRESITTREAYVKALLAQTGDIPASALDVFISGSLAIVENSRDAKLVSDSAKVRTAAGAVFQEMIIRSMGKPDVVREIRALPEDKIRTAAQIDRASLHSPSGLSEPGISCVVGKWRKHSDLPNRWLAWKELVQCTGW